MLLLLLLRLLMMMMAEGTPGAAASRRHVLLACSRWARACLEAHVNLTPHVPLTHSSLNTCGARSCPLRPVLRQVPVLVHGRVVGSACAARFPHLEGRRRG